MLCKSSTLILIYANNEQKSVLARDLGDCCDNLRNSPERVSHSLGEDKMADVRKHMVFHGRVQGVGFRYTAKYLARSMNLTGWVKNEYDGTVVMEVQGRETMIFELMKGLNRNQFIQIDWIDTEEKETETESSFEVKY